MMLSRWMRKLHWIAVAVTLATVIASTAEARPTYFQVLTERYNIEPDDRTYACGNCHFIWTGTGARNPFDLTRWFSELFNS